MTAFLGDFATVRTGLVTARKKAQLDSVEKIGYRQISLRYFGFGVKLNRVESETFESKEPVNEKYLTQQGDVVVRLRAPSSAVYIEKEDEGLLIHSLLAVIRMNGNANNTIDPRYLAYYINATSTQHILKKSIKGTAIPMLKTKDLEELKVSFPYRIEEQQNLVRLLELSEKERRLLQELSEKKKQLSQSYLDTIIQQNKEAICQK